MRAKALVLGIVIVSSIAIFWACMGGKFTP